MKNKLFLAISFFLICACNYNNKMHENTLKVDIDSTSFYLKKEDKYITSINLEDEDLEIDSLFVYKNINEGYYEKYYRSKNLIISKVKTGYGRLKLFLWDLKNNKIIYFPKEGSNIIEVVRSKNEIITYETGFGNDPGPIYASFYYLKKNDLILSKSLEISRLEQKKIYNTNVLCNEDYKKYLLLLTNMALNSRKI